ncbi:kinase-like domain-containing protein [Sporodiniella umbellata]|nr:kinase-like domain-containing protein [Sporodiniella umbellata]
MTNNQYEKTLLAQSLLYTTIDRQTIQLISVLGIGAYGIVYLGQDLLNGQKYAIKLLTHMHMSRRETEIHAYLSGHPNILGFEKIVKEGSRVFMVLEYAPQGDLFGAITQPGRGVVGNNDAIRHIFLQIIDAVHYCHQKNIFHRDLKPENIMLDSGWKVKLADFGLATTHHVSDEFGCGSTFYFSPECQGGTYRHHTHIKGYSTEKNDVWSLGVILINLVAGRNPWKQAHMLNATFTAYVRHPHQFFRKVLPCISDELENILLRIFCLNPALRISLPELRFYISRCMSFTKPNIPSLTQIHKQSACVY